MSSKQTQLFDAPAPAVSGLVASYVSLYRERTGRRPPERVLGQVSRQVKQLLQEGRKAEMLELALKNMVQKTLSPTLLPQLVAEEELRYATQDARFYVAKNGWPTGWRFKRSDASGVYKRDILGHDFPPRERPVTPTLEQIQQALEERER